MSNRIPKYEWSCLPYSNHLGIYMWSWLKGIYLKEAFILFPRRLIIFLIWGFRFLKMARGGFCFMTNNWVLIITKGSTQVYEGRELHHAKLILNLSLQVLNKHPLKVRIGNLYVNLGIKWLVVWNNSITFSSSFCLHLIKSTKVILGVMCTWKWFIEASKSSLNEWIELFTNEENHSKVVSFKDIGKA